MGLSFNLVISLLVCVGLMGLLLVLAFLGAGAWQPGALPLCLLPVCFQREVFFFSRFFFSEAFAIHWMRFSIDLIEF